MFSTCNLLIITFIVSVLTLGVYAESTSNNRSFGEPVKRIIPLEQQYSIFDKNIDKRK